MVDYKSVLPIVFASIILVLVGTLAIENYDTQQPLEKSAYGQSTTTVTQDCSPTTVTAPSLGDTEPITCNATVSGNTGRVALGFGVDCGIVEVPAGGGSFTCTSSRSIGAKTFGTTFTFNVLACVVPIGGGICFAVSENTIITVHVLPTASLSCSPDTLSILQESSATSLCNIIPERGVDLRGYNLGLGCEPLAGVSCSFNPGSLGGGATSFDLTVSVGSIAPAAYNLEPFVNFPGGKARTGITVNVEDVCPADAASTLNTSQFPTTLSILPEAYAQAVTCDAKVTAITPIQVVSDVPLVGGKTLMVRVGVSISGIEYLKEVNARVELDMGAQSLGVRDVLLMTFKFGEMDITRAFPNDDQGRAELVLAKQDPLFYFTSANHGWPGGTFAKVNFDEERGLFTPLAGQITLHAKVTVLDEGFVDSNPTNDEMTSTFTFHESKFSNKKPFKMLFQLADDPTTPEGFFGDPDDKMNILRNVARQIRYVEANYPIPTSSISHELNPKIVNIDISQGKRDDTFKTLEKKHCPGKYNICVFVVPDHTLFLAGELDGNSCSPDACRVILMDSGPAMYILAHEMMHLYKAGRSDHVSKFVDEGWDPGNGVFDTRSLEWFKTNKNRVNWQSLNNEVGSRPPGSPFGTPEVEWMIREHYVDLWNRIFKKN